MKILTIVAGGKGTRLASEIGDLPKVLAPIGNKDNLTRQIELGVKYDFDKIIILTGFGSEKVEVRIDELRLEYPTLDITIIPEDKPLGTAGCFLPLVGQVDAAMLVLYGDIYCEFNLEAFYNFHQSHDGVASVLVQPNSHMYDSDLVEIDLEKNITAILKKPHPEGQLFANLTNAAAYVIDPSVLTYIPAKSCDWFHDVFPSMLAQGAMLKAYQSWEYLQDFGTPDRYQKANEDAHKGTYASKHKFAGSITLALCHFEETELLSTDCIAFVKTQNDLRIPVFLWGKMTPVIQQQLVDHNVYADFIVNAEELDMLKVKAICSENGIIPDQITLFPNPS